MEKLFTYAPNTEAEIILRQHVPGLWERGKKILYVGASQYSRAFADTLHDGGATLTLLEPFERNADYYRRRIGRPFDSVHGGTALSAALIIPFGSFDYALWWHGPEHSVVPKADLFSLELVAFNVVVGCPWGIYPQGAEYGNPYERHVSHLQPHDLNEFGYETRTIGRMDDPNGCIVAWKTS